MLLVEIHNISKVDEYFEMLDNFCFKAKNLYNNALYHIKQYYLYKTKLESGESIENLNVSPEVISYMKDKGSYINYNDMDKLSKQLNNSLTADYRSLPIASASQQVLKALNTNWLSFFKANKKFQKNPNKFTGKPKPPKYLAKNDRYLLKLTNQACKLRDGYIIFPKSFQDFRIKTRVNNLREVRVIPKVNYFQIEIVYEVEEKELLPDNKRYLSVDIGVNNLCAITNNFNGNQWLISGKPVKAINRFYNDTRAKYCSILTKQFKTTKIKDSNRLQKLREKRNNRINTYFHKVSKKLIDLALNYEVSKIVIGYNEGWKQNSKLSKGVNQKFQLISYEKLVDMVKYKGLLEGIEVITVEESYTSGTSFLDEEMPVKENYDKSRRIYRGLFRSNNGRYLNSDVNGSYQILKKYLGTNYLVFPNNLSVLKVI